MNPSRDKASIVAAALFCLAVGAGWTQDQERLDGPRHIFRDPLLDKMLGTWKVSGKVAGRNADQTVRVDWVLNHQFLRIHETNLAPVRRDDVSYEAIVMLGYDNASDRYVAHWNDIYGGRFSETLGYGSRSGNDIHLVFEYPDGPFHTTFRWKPEMEQWEWLMRTKDKSGQWVEFADMTLARCQAQ